MGFEMSVCARYLTLASVLLLAGCSSQDFGRPVARLADGIDSGESYTDSSEEDMAKLRAKQLGKMLVSWEQSRTQTDRDYVVGRDDVLQVGILSLDKPDEVTSILRAVRQDGTIALPLLGDVAVGGMTVRDLEDRIVKALNGRFLKDPEVSVKVADYRSLPVVITGAVTLPGVYYLKHNKSSALEILSMAQGLTIAAGNRLLIVRSNPPVAETAHAPASAVVSAAPAAAQAADPLITDSTLETVEQKADPEDSTAALASTDAQIIEVDLDQLVGQGDVRLNVTVLGGDIITVAPRKKAFVYVLGYVQTPGAFELEGSSRVDALQAVARAGGLSIAARAQNSFLVTERGGKRKIIEVDLTKIARGVRPPVYMGAGDTLVVGSGFMAKLGEFIKPSVGVGASLAPIP